MKTFKITITRTMKHNDSLEVQALTLDQAKEKAIKLAMEQDDCVYWEEVQFSDDEIPVIPSVKQERICWSPFEKPTYEVEREKN